MENKLRNLCSDDIIFVHVLMSNIAIPFITSS